MQICNFVLSLNQQQKVIDMTTQEWKSLKKDQQLKILNPLIDIARDMILAGTLKKNVSRFFVNRGFPQLAADNLVELGELRAEKFTHYKIK